MISRYSIKLNKDQTKSLLRKWKQNNQGLTYLQFRRTVQPGWDGKEVLLSICSTVVMVKWSGMWLGIEEDGYTHS